MSQSAEKVLDHSELFQGPEYQEMFANKKCMFENAVSPEEFSKVSEWTQSREYQEKNFAREAVVINPARACQPLGAVFAAVGFEGTLPFVHGSQGCVAYYRSHFSRHFKEPTSAVSSSMTEDAAVFGGMGNMIDGLANAKALYNPKMIAVSTTCMAEVIGDDLNSFIKNAKENGTVPVDLDIPFSHTPAFVGSHITGYDNALKGILEHFWDGKSGTVPPLEPKPVAGKVNFIGGFDGYTVGNMREIKRIFKLLGVDATILSDPSDYWDTPGDGTYRMYDGGTTLAETSEAVNASATISMQEFCTPKTLDFIEGKGQEVIAFNHPIGVEATDRFLLELSRLTGRQIPEELTRERGRLVDAMADSSAYLHGKKFAVFGDPDLTIGMTSFLLEMGAEPVHIVCSNGSPVWKEKIEVLLANSPFGKNCRAYAGKDLWHLRSLLFTEPVDFLIGSTYGKFLERDTNTPLIRIGFPIFDRHHHHRYPVWGYQGALNVLVWILDKVLDEADRKSKDSCSFDAVR